MKKILLLITLLFTTVLFIGCAKVSMEYEIDTDNTLQIRYTVIIDKTNEEFANVNYFNVRNAIKQQWELQEMDVTIDDDSEQLHFIGVYSKTHDTRQQAFESLDAILKSEYSPFTDLGFEYASSYFEDEYRLSGEVQLNDIIRRSENQVVPTDMQQSFKKCLDESDFSISIALPGEAKDTNANSKSYQDNVTTYLWNLEYGDTTNLELTSIIVNEKHVEYHKKLSDDTNQIKWILIFCGAGALIVLVVFLVVFSIIRRRG